MIFGNKELFAIEANLIQGNECIFVEICYWIKNIMIGDIEQRCLLSSYIPFIDDILKNKGKRKIDFNEFTSSIELMNYLISNGLENDDKNSKEYKMISQLDIHSNETESFNGVFIYLIETSSYDWLLSKDILSKEVVDIKIPKNIFYKEFKRLKDWINHSTILRLKSAQ